MDSLKNNVCGFLGIAGGFISTYFGGWDAGVLALFVVLMCDFVAGLVAVCVFGSNREAEKCCSKLEAINRDFFRKMTILFFVLIGHILDMYFHTSFVRDSIVISFLCIELVSFADNAIIIGVPTPSIFKDVLDYLHKKPEYKKDRSRRTKNSIGGGN